MERFWFGLGFLLENTATFSITLSVNENIKLVSPLLSTLWNCDVKRVSRRCQAPLNLDGSTVNFLLCGVMTISGVH